MKCVVYASNGIGYSSENEQTVWTITWVSSKTYNNKQKKPDVEEYLLYDSIYTKLKNGQHPSAVLRQDRKATYGTIDPTVPQSVPPITTSHLAGSH